MEITDWNNKNVLMDSILSGIGAGKEISRDTIGCLSDGCLSVLLALFLLIYAKSLRG